MRNTLPPREHCSLGYFDKNRIERAIDQVAAGAHSVHVSVLHGGQEYRVLISKALNHKEVLASRS